MSREALDCVLPQEFMCPISLTLLQDPVLALDGHSYERKHIEHWFSTGKSTSPLTNEELNDQRLITNHALRRAIESYLHDALPRQKKLEAETFDLRKRIRTLEMQRQNITHEDFRGTDIEEKNSETALPSAVISRLKHIELLILALGGDLEAIQSRQRATTTLALATAHCTISPSRNDSPSNKESHHILSSVLAGERDVFTPDMLRAAGFSAAEARCAGFSAEECAQAKYNKFDCKTAGFTPFSVFSAGLAPQMATAIRDSPTWPTFKQCHAMGLTLLQLQASGYLLEDAKAHHDLYTASEFKRAGCSASLLKKIGFSIAECRSAAYSSRACRSAGWLNIPDFLADTTLFSHDDRDPINKWPTLAALRRAGYSLRDCESYGYDAIADSARTAGFDALDFKKSEKTAADCRLVGFRPTELKSAGYTAAECKAAGYTTNELIPIWGSKLTAAFSKAKGGLANTTTAGSSSLHLTASQQGESSIPRGMPTPRNRARTPPGDARYFASDVDYHEENGDVISRPTTPHHRPPLTNKFASSTSRQSARSTSRSALTTSLARLRG